jgi:predicted N-acyltransferase
VSALAYQALPGREEVVTFPRTDWVPPAEWNRLVRRGFHLRSWFSVAERCGWNSRHLAIEDATGRRAIVPVYLTNRTSLHDLHERWLGPLASVAAASGLGLRPSLTVQAPFALTSDLLHDGRPLSDAAVHRVFDALEEQAQADNARAIVWPFVDLASADILRVGRERGYAQFYAGATAQLRIRWESLDDYIASRSKSVRRSIRADLDGMRSAGLRLTGTTEFWKEAPAMEQLHRESITKRGRGGPIDSLFFTLLAGEAMPRPVAQLTWQGDRLVGSSVNLPHADLLDGTLAALVPEMRGGPAYYNDLIYEPIRLACGQGIAAVDLGPTALYPKVLRGATLRRRMALVRGTSPAVHATLGALGAVVARRQERKEQRALGALWSTRCFLEQD